MLRKFFRAGAVAGTVLLLLGAASAPLRAGVAEAEFRKPEDLVRWITVFREAPDPAQLPQAVRAMSRHGLFKDSESAAFYIGFIAGIIGDNQVDAHKIIDSLFPMPPREQAVVIKAIAYSGLPDWKGTLEQFADYMPARRMLIGKYLYGDGKPLTEVPLDNGNAVVDTLWGYYFATGSYEPVLRIFTSLRWMEATDDPKRLTIANMAMVTLASNAARDENLLRLYHIQVPHQPAGVRKPLRKVVDAVEAFETHKIRKEAEAAIARARALGPVKPPSKWAWANQAGQTALSVGCVVASALGHPEVAAPCIITGALYSGATKLSRIGQKP